MDENSDSTGTEQVQISSERLGEFAQAVLDVWQTAFADVIPEFAAPVLVGLGAGVAGQHDICTCSACEAASDDVIDFIAGSLRSRLTRLQK